MTLGAASPVYAFLRNPSMVDYPGHLAVVFFTSGCNFRCGFCHNAELITRQQKQISWERLADVCDKYAADWVDAAVITGGEPTLEAGLMDFVEFLKERGWLVKLDTNGSRPETIRKCISRVDYIAMDVKAGFSSYAELTGWNDTDVLSESISLIREKAKDYEFRTTVIESFHTLEQMREIGQAIRGARRYVLQPFLPKPDLPDPAFASRPRTSAEKLKEFQLAMQPFADQVVIRGG